MAVAEGCPRNGKKAKTVNIDKPFKRKKWSGEAAEDKGQESEKLLEGSRQNRHKTPFEKKKFTGYSELFTEFYGAPRISNRRIKNAKTSFTVLNNKFEMRKYL